MNTVESMRTLTKSIYDLWHAKAERNCRRDPAWIAIENRSANDTKSFDDLMEQNALFHRLNPRPMWLKVLLFLDEEPDKIAHSANWSIQRAQRGWSDHDLETFDHYLSGVIISAVRELGARTTGGPEGLTTEQWRSVLSTIADGFEARERLAENPDVDEETAEELARSASRAWSLLRTYFDALWA
jgi:hypothetical protein